MRLLPLIWTLPAVWAVFREDAFVVDWAIYGMGLPVHAEDLSDGGLAVVSSNDVLSVVDEAGVTTWRRVLNKDEAAVGVAVANDTVITGGSVITGWNASSGAVRWTLSEGASQVYSVGDKAYAASGESLFEVSSTGEKFVAQSKVKSQHSLTTTSGSVTVDANDMVRFTTKNGTVVWKRDESLASVTSAVFIEKPRPEPVKEQEHPAEKTDKITAKDLYKASPVKPKAKEYDQSTIWGAWRARVHRHLTEAQSFSALGGAIFSSIFDVGVDTASKQRLFGFDKLLVLTSRTGSVIALDVLERGETVWKRDDLDAQSIGVNADNQLVVTTSAHSKVILDAIDGSTVGDIEKDQTIKALNGSVNYSVSKDNRTIDGHLGWSFNPGNQIVAVAQRESADQTASLGVVLPDNSVQYKYLNPNALAVATYDESAKQLAVYLIDGVTGRLLSSAVHEEKLASKNVNLVYGESWIAYTFETLVGSRLSLWDLYESAKPDVRVSPEGELDPLTDLSVPVVQRKEFATEWSGPVRALAISRTDVGVTTRDIIVSVDGEVFALPKLSLSHPNAPPLITVPQNSHLSHIRNVWGIDSVLVEPSKLESTYMVAGFGSLDVFYTRAAPSGEYDKLPDSFGKKKLFGIILSLAVMLFLIIPLARRKRNTFLWA